MTSDLFRLLTTNSPDLHAANGPNQEQIRIKYKIYKNISSNRDHAWDEINFLKNICLQC